MCNPRKTPTACRIWIVHAGRWVKKGGKRGKMVLLLSTASLHGPGDGGNAPSKGRHLPPQPLAYAQRGRDCIRHPERSSQGRGLQDFRSMSREEGCRAHSNLGPKRGQACHPLWQGASPGCVPAPLVQRREGAGVGRSLINHTVGI